MVNTVCEKCMRDLQWMLGAKDNIFIIVWRRLALTALILALPEVFNAPRYLYVDGNRIGEIGAAVLRDGQ